MVLCMMVGSVTNIEEGSDWNGCCALTPASHLKNLSFVHICNEFHQHYDTIMLELSINSKSTVISYLFHYVANKWLHLL